MNKLAELKFDHLGIGTMIHREQLRVPPNQREYSWTKDNVDDLYRDIADAIADHKSIYFLGTVVLATPDDQNPEVVDGQQRLATTTILLAAMRDFMLENNDPEFAQHIEVTYLFRFDRKTRETVSKLVLNVDDNQYFKDRILMRPTSPERMQCATPSQASHHLLKQAAEMAAERVRTITQGYSNIQSRLNEWLDYLQDRVIVIVLRALSDMDAFTMFETLNDRGLPTTQADLLKNYLLKQVGDVSMAEAQTKWSAMRTSLEPLGIDDVVVTYLRHLTLAIYGPSQEKGFYERLQKDVHGKSKSLAFLDSLARYADDYAALLTPSHSKWNTYTPKTRSSLETIKQFQVAQIRPLMLAVAQHFSTDEADKAFRAFLCWSVRFLIVGGGRGQRLEDAYAEQAYKVTTGVAVTIKDIRSNLVSSSVLPNDNVFETSFANATVSKNQLARYYLRALEATVKNETKYPEVMPVEDSTVVNLEHIMPYSISAEWQHITPEIATAYGNRIGNMVLMNAKKNALIGNSGFQTKHKAFKESTIMLTSEVSEKNKSDILWGPNEIKQRQERLAQIAVKTWPL